MTLLERLRKLHERLEQDGAYVDSNIVYLGTEAIHNTSEILRLITQFYQEDTLCRPLTDAERALERAATEALKSIGLTPPNSTLTPTTRSLER